MEIIKRKINAVSSFDFESEYNLNDLLFFDIETTGFSADLNFVYLIGVSYYFENSYYIIQWFNDDNTSENEIIESFNNFIQDYKYIIHYNGDGFDIPFLIKRGKKTNSNIDFTRLISIDLYKEIKPYKNLLKLDSLKLKSIEKFLDIYRRDIFDGGQLIKKYFEYLNTGNSDIKEILLLHNFEDVEGMLKTTSIYSYKFISQINKIESIYTDAQKENILIEGFLKYEIPKGIAFGDNFVLTIRNNFFQIKIPLYDGELKFFYKNFKDYYYLPIEDKAIHKSVAAFVDGKYREKAKKDNCYQRKESIFIRTYSLDFINIFKPDINSIESYIELESFLDYSLEDKIKYANEIINYAIRK